MLGITVSDSIALATLIGGTIATIIGLKWGKASREAGPPNTSQYPVAFMGGAITDHAVMERLTLAIEGVAKALIAGIASNERISADQVAERLEDIKNSSDVAAQRMDMLLQKIEERELGRKAFRSGKPGEHHGQG